MSLFFCHDPKSFQSSPFTLGGFFAKFSGHLYLSKRFLI